MRELNWNKRQLAIYMAVAFGVTYVMGIFMWYGYSTGNGLAAFAGAQMLYPAAGVILALLVTVDKKELPIRFFAVHLVTTVLSILCAVAEVLIAQEGDMTFYLISNWILVVGSVVGWPVLLTEKKEKRRNWGLKWNDWKRSLACIFLFLLVYTLRNVFLYALGGELGTIISIGKSPMTWLMLISILFNYFLVYLAFFGEEYGWRYYLQPLLQKRFGMKKGVFILGVLWGLWHLPLDFFYYTNPSMGLPMLASQIVTCICLGIFFAYAYQKTKNIWVPVLLHFFNNNLVMIFAQNYSAEVLENQIVTWETVLVNLLASGLFFGFVIFSKVFREKPEKEEEGSQE